LASFDSVAWEQASQAALSAEKVTAGVAAEKAKRGGEKLANPVAEVEKTQPAAEHVKQARRRNVVASRTTAIRLQHTPAMDVSNTLREYLGASGLNHAAVVVPNVISNTLLVRASDEQMTEIMRIVEQLDRQPPMVHIRALIAAVKWDAECLDEAVSGTVTSNDSTEKIAAPKPASAIESGKGLLSLDAVHRELEFSVLETSEASESLEKQVCALQGDGRLDILARSQIMTLDNQAAFIQVSKRVPRITGTHMDSRGRTNQVELKDVGLTFGVTPRVSAQSTVVMEIDLEMSDVRDDEDVMLSSIEEGPAIHAAEIAVTTVQSTVTVASGETIVLGGTATKSKRQRVELLILLSAAIVSSDREEAGMQ